MNKLLLTYLGVDFLFLLCGGLLLGFSLVNQQQQQSKLNTSTVAFSVLLNECPLAAGVVNAVFVFITFLVSLPALALPTNRGWLKLQGLLVVICSFFTLVLGLFIWFDTLQTRKNLGSLWGEESSEIQSLLQQRFNCCGYLDSSTPPFITDNTCPNSLSASQKMGCVGPFSSFANSWLDLIFTAAFGMVGLDVLLLLCIAMVIKHRGELERYRHIDEKLGMRF
jgi:hypothetical protein